MDSQRNMNIDLNVRVRGQKIPHCCTVGCTHQQHKNWGKNLRCLFTGCQRGKHDIGRAEWRSGSSDQISHAKLCGGQFASMYVSIYYLSA